MLLFEKQFYLLLLWQYCLAGNLEKKGFEGVDLLNVNIPANPSSDEFEVVHLGERMYIPQIDKRLDPRNRPYYWIGSEEYKGDKIGSDGYALKKNQKSTITPLKLDFTGDLGLIKEWLR